MQIQVFRILINKYPPENKPDKLLHLLINQNLETTTNVLFKYFILHDNTFLNVFGNPQWGFHSFPGALASLIAMVNQT